MDQKSNIAVLILAAGESSRMGDRVKQLLPWKQTTLLQNAIEQVEASKAIETYIVLGANRTKIIDRLALDTVTIIENNSWQQGLGSSISEGINYFSTYNKKYEAVLIMLADQPLIDTSYLEEMIALWESNKATVVATKYNKRAGVPAIFGTSHFPALKKLNKDFGAKEIIDQQKDAIFVLDPKGKEIDLDTWEAYQQLIKELN